MIAISSVTQDTSGHVVIYNNAEYRENFARISRIKTLDGGVCINNSGVSDGDRTLDVRIKVTESQAETLWHIFNTYTFVNVSIPDGVYYAAIESLDIKNKDMSMSILINNKENI